MTPNQSPANATTVERVIAVFERFMHRLMATHAPELNAIEMTMSQTKAMYLLIAAGRLRMSELAARLGVTSSTATGAVDGLVALGLVERHEDPVDRRQVVVTPTATAETTLEHFRELNSRRMGELLGRLSPSDLATVERAMEILDATVASEAPSGAEPSSQPEGD
ncbi:MAG TPA: MarR family transcriptional regulator [Candidatus Limnocylindrales bacterium]